MISLIKSLNKVRPQARGSVPLLREIYGSYKILSEVANRNGPDSHSNSATELADRRFDTWTEKSGEAREIANN